VSKEMYAATGRRKRSVARIRLVPGSGKVRINGKSPEEYFSVKTVIEEIFQPLKVSDTVNNFDVFANVDGGGFRGQAEAIRHGIARALLQYNADLRPVLKKEGFLTRDPREKERKKYGLHRARKARQYRKR
jgi:small subunit ribosomal protein S9